MVSHLLFYQLTLIALVWLCVMLHWVWPSDAPTCPPPPEPTPPVPKRHREPKPFAGLTTKPPCDACEHGTTPPEPMAIPVAVPGGNCCASPVAAIFWRPSARSSTASVWHQSSWCG